MPEIYISSTFEDLQQEREAVSQVVRRLGHRAIAMEDYAASDQRPVKKCIKDVKSCDAYIGIFAWRYGYIPDDYDKSITHLEYEAAKEKGIPCLIFLLDGNAQWPVNYVSTGAERQKIDELRSKLKKDHVVSFFKNADELSSKVSAAVSRLIFVTEKSGTKFKRPGELIGTRLGKYEILEKLGRGGKGVVFKVMDTLEDSEKAIKMVPPQVADSPLAFKELKRELKIASRIIHANVVKVMGLEEHDEQFFIVMEYIEGKNLEQILADSKAGKLTETEVIALMKKIARGLLETHKSNVIHRDIKPSNIMLTPGGQVKILDFGISYQVTRSMTQLVGEQQWKGTWPYMAPEQLSTLYGRENKQVDIWGFGVTMYQLLSGEFPFSNKEQIKDLNEKPYELEGVSGETRDIVMKCLEKDRAKRWKNMEEILAALNSIEPVEPVPIPEPVTNKEEIPKDEDAIKAVAQAAKKVYKNKKGLWEADYGNGIIMVYIPPGEFTMGSNDYDDEKPPHKVYLDGYWMGKFQVTVGQYKAFLSESGYQALPYYVSEYSPGDNHPVVGVSWKDADAYCKWLSEKTGLHFKLPTEAQWEKAARGTDNRKYPWGDKEPGETLANFGYKIEKTKPVGSYPEGTSPYGLLDMAGNAWEWCRDWYDKNYYESSPAKNPTGPRSGTRRVVRGGGWSYSAGLLRCASRSYVRSSDRSGNLGFRLSQDIK